MSHAAYILLQSKYGVDRKKGIKNKIIIFCIMYVYYFGTLKSQRFKQILNRKAQC